MQRLPRVRTVTANEELEFRRCGRTLGVGPAVMCTALHQMLLSACSRNISRAWGSDRL
jgi:hypothetical protein